jgi:ribosomal protein S27AE
VPTLMCPRCGLAYHSSTLPQHLLSTSRASCARCAAPLTEARRDVAHDRRPRFGSTPDRHRAAVTKTLGWAEHAAAEGDYATALAWLETIEAVDGEIPSGFDAKRRVWAQAARAATAER